ncbi:triple tyrosine motif-containing protein [Lewinella sp. LCG006]|uniref:helix-turn-helix and ligand-binding sensor domain-containing protein n=1 Tax=Lewinella sp. LCG006 TaxID=3231911 RepID=UPI00345FD372
MIRVFAKYIRFLFLLLSQLLLFGQLTIAQGDTFVKTNRSRPETPRVRTFTPNDYQASNQNWMVAQSSDGSMHIANSGGLLTYNGNYWLLHTLPGQKVVRSVAIGADDKVYVGAYNEFGYFDMDADDGSSYVSISKYLPKAELGEEIWNIIVLDSVVLFHSFGAIYIYNGKHVEKVLPPGVILNMIQVDDQLFVPVIDEGLFQWRPGGAFSLLAGTEALAGKNIRGVVSVDSCLLIATERSGIFQLQNGHLSKWEIPLSGVLVNDQINQFEQLRSGLFAVGTILGGLYLLHKDGHLHSRLDRSGGLQNNTIISMLEDTVGNLWLGLDRGIDLVVLNDPLRYFTASQQAIGAVYAAAIFNDRLYIGTNQGLFQRPLNSIAPYQLVAGTQGQVWELSVMDDQLLCGHNNGTYLIENQDAVLISEVTGGWQLSPLAHHSPKFLQATYTGVIRLDRKKEQWTFSQPFPGLTAPLDEIIRTDTFEFLAAHASEGLYCLRLNADYSAYEKIEALGEKEGLPEGHSFHMTKFSEGVLVQTADQKWLYKNRQFLPIDTFRGEVLLPNSWVLAGREDQWMQATFNQVWMYNYEELPVRLPIKLARHEPKLINLSNGQSLFCLDEGYALLDPEQLTVEMPSSTLFIRWEYYDDKENWQSLPDTQATLAFRQNQLRFSFHQPVYDEPGLYRYQLKGFDTGWSEWSTRYEKEYTNLPAGKYEFMVTSQFSGVSRSIAFEINPPWYLSGWSFVLYTILALLIWWGLYRLHNWRLHRQALALELKRKRELQHERIQLRNEQLQADIIGKSKALANSTFNLVRKNEILLTLKQELRTAAQRSLSERDYYKLKDLIDKHLSGEQDWEMFESNFNQVHDDFFKRLKKAYPDLTPGDLKLAAYLRMNLSSKEIAPLLHISIRGVENKRYRLRKKTNLDANDSLTDFFMNY